MPKSTKRLPQNNPTPTVGQLTPWTMLQASLRAYPPLKYALGVLGIVSAIAIIKSFGIDYRVAIFGTIIMLVLMVALVVFAALTKSSNTQVQLASYVLMWSLLAITILSASLLFTSTFFDFPKPITEILGVFSNDKPKPTPLIDEAMRNLAPLTAEEKKELETLTQLFQTLIQKSMSRTGIASAIQHYATSPTKGNWNQVSHYAAQIQSEVKRFDEVRDSTLAHFAALNSGLYKDLLGVLDEKSRLLSLLDGLPFPHTEEQFVEIKQIGDDFSKLQDKMKTVSTELEEYLKFRL